MCPIFLFFYGPSVKSIILYILLLCRLLRVIRGKVRRGEYYISAAVRSVELKEISIKFLPLSSFLRGHTHPK